MSIMEFNKFDPLRAENGLRLDSCYITDVTDLNTSIEMIFLCRQYHTYLKASMSVQSARMHIFASSFSA